MGDYKLKIAKYLNEFGISDEYYLKLIYIYKFFKKRQLEINSVYKNIISDNEIHNVYHATVQKTASQWVKAIFQDERIKEYSGLEVYPQHRYEWGEFHKKFPKHTFIPGLYIPYQLYTEIKKPKKYKTFYIIRDPRNIVVSWYYSMLETHFPMGKVSEHRKKLKKLNFEDGISYCIKAQHLKFAFMRSWIYGSKNDPNVLIIKFEDLVKNSFKEFKKIFKHCNISVPDSTLKVTLNDYTKEKMRKRDLMKRKDSKSHYRKRSSNWEEVFNKKHKELFYGITGDLVDILGYKR